MFSRVRRAAALVIAAAGALAGVGGVGRPALARTTRPLFEPTDLELEDEGVVEVDLQIGGIRSQGPWRAVMPDFELDVGVLPGLELDLDGAYAVEGPATGPFSFDHAAPDSLWPCAKIGLYDAHDRPSGRGLAVGVQVGPKLPVAPGAHGIGVESLMLVGAARGHFHAVVNAGGFVEPAPSAGAPRPAGLEVGLDLEQVLDAAERFSLTGELSAVRFVSSDPHQLLATAGLTWAALETLDLSVTGLLGVLAGSDRYGVLVGVSPKLRLFRGRSPSAPERGTP